MHGVNTYRHKASRLDAVAVDADVAHGQPADPRGRRAQPQRLVQHLNGVSEPRDILGCQLPTADLGGLGSDAVLYVAVVASAHKA